MIRPFKKSKHYLLTGEAKLFNRDFVRGRIIVVVESVLAQFKNFKALAERLRHCLDRWDDVFRAVLAIINRRPLKRVTTTQGA